MSKRLSWPSWLTYSGWLTHTSGHPSSTSRAQDSENTSAKDQCSTAGLYSKWFTTGSTGDKVWCLRLHYALSAMWLLIPPPRRLCNRRRWFVCLSVSNFAQKTSKRICMKFSGKVGNGPRNKRLNFDGDRDPGKACLGGGMHCPSASSYIYHLMELHASKYAYLFPL